MSSCTTNIGKVTRSSNGYAKVYDPKTQKKVRAHRYVWEKHYGKIPEGCVIMHTCDNRACTNIEHLRCGTQSENLADMYKKGRQGRRNFPKGEGHHATTLSSDEVYEIRNCDYYRGMYTYYAEKFKVTRQTVANIYKGHTWTV